MWLACFLLSLLAAPADRDVQAIARAVEGHYHSATTLRATFLERYSQGGQSVRVESGTAYFSRPGRMRWEYESPVQKLFVVDGKTAWFYVPADRTVTRAPVKESADWHTPLALLTGKAKLSRLCSRIDLLEPSSEAAHGLRATAGNHVVLRCLPRGQPLQPKSNLSGDRAVGEPDDAFTEVLLEVEPNVGEIERAIVQQPGGVEIEYRFGNWQRDLELPEALFHFRIPTGVTVLDTPTTREPGG